jgi:hypothetical protein
MQIGRKIYYDITNGNVILDTGEREGWVTETSIEEDINTFTTLSERNRDTFDVIELPFGAYTQDFRDCNGHIVNLVTKEIEFSYPDPSEPETPTVYQKPLTQQVQELKDELAVTQKAVDFILMGGM